MFKLNKRIMIIATLIMILLLFAGCYSSDITGKWIYNGQVIEFLSDGTIFYDGCSDMYPPTYEITDEGYLKIGVYDYGWVTYEYTYLTIDSDGDILTLTDKANTDQVYVLERSTGSYDVEENNDVSESNSGGGSNNILSNLIQTEEEKALAAIKKYFEAYGDMDLEAIHNASYPKGCEMDSRMVCETEYDFFDCWINFLGMGRSRFDYTDWTKVDPTFLVYKDYPLVYEGVNGELLNYEGEQLTLDEVLPNFLILYEIIEMKPYEECSVYYRVGLDEFHEIASKDEIVRPPYGEYIAVDNMYVAQVKVEYYYGDDLYGYNKDWWNDETFYERSYVKSYEEEIEDCIIESIFFVYEYDGNWYVYPHQVNRYGFYKVEF